MYVCVLPVRPGDEQGNVRVYDVGSLGLVAIKEAHDGEVLALDFSSPTLGTAGWWRRTYTMPYWRAFRTARQCSAVA